MVRFTSETAGDRPGSVFFRASVAAIRLFGALLLTGLALAWASTPALASTSLEKCGQLRSLSVKDLEIHAAELVRSGNLFTSPATSGGGKPQLISNVPAFCRLSATAHPTPDSSIDFEVWMPVEGWNGKFMGIGNGAWWGRISFQEMSQNLARGYAVASTNTGHNGDPDDASFAVGHPERLTDFAYRGVHLMTVNAKAVIAAYYGRPARYAYWLGCSSGGRQGLKEAQLFPEDYDGIIAGAPASWWTNLLSWEVYLAKAAKVPGAAIPPGMLPRLAEAVLARCDKTDGVVDGLIGDPRKCRFRAEELGLGCHAAAGGNCLTDQQLQLIDIAYAPMRDRNGTVLFPGLQPGSELYWGILLGEHSFQTPENYFKSVIFKNEQWDFRTFDVDRDLQAAISIDRAGPSINAINPDLSKFNARGGKIIQYMGWSDQYIAPESSIEYFDTVNKTMGNTASFYKLFMIPGMSHCFGGCVPDQFDKVAAIENWVERGLPPSGIVVAQTNEDLPYSHTVVRTRPLCAYPLRAKYSGSGSIDEASSFACAAD